jgi:arginyl-tRNA synthetase
MATNPQGTAEKMLKDLGRRIDELIVDLHEAKDKASVEYAKEIEELKKGRDKVQSEIDEFRERHKERFDEIEESLERAGRELRNAFETAFKRKEKE